MSWQDDLNWSNRIFLQQVWPIIASKCGGGEIKPVEIIHDNIIAKELDLLCGIDVWQTIKGAGARGIASRVQRGNFDTFTIRYQRDSGSTTEYEKRKEAIDTGKFIYPYLTCHAYVNAKTEKLLSVGLVKTVDLFGTLNPETSSKRRCENAVFLFEHFKNIPGCWIWPNRKNETVDHASWFADYDRHFD